METACFQSALALLCGDESHHLELRLCTAAELCSNSQHYANIVVKYSTSCVNCMSPESLLSSILKQELSNLFAEALESSCSLEEEYHRAVLAEVSSTCSPGCYTSVLHSYGLSAAVDAWIKLVYPMFNEGIRPFLNGSIVPRERYAGSKDQKNVSISIM